MRVDNSRDANIAACNRALCELLNAMITFDQDADAQRRRWALAEAVGRSFDGTEVRTLVTDPVRGSMRSGVKAFGRELHRLGGLDAMLASLETVASADEDNYGRRGMIIDSAWNGIGDDEGRWWS